MQRGSKKSYGSGVALRDGTFAIVATGEDGDWPAEIWSWDPATDRVTEMPTAAFTAGRVPRVVTDGVDLFAEDNGAGGTSTRRIWKVDLAAQRATAIHDEAYRPPSETFFLGADRDVLYMLDRV